MRKEVKGKGERERYIQLNTKFQRIKAFSSEQCNEIEGKITVGKTRDFFNKIGSSKGIFHEKILMMKDRNGKDLREAEEIKKWQEYTKLHTQKILITQMITMVWALTYNQISWSVKSSGP